MQAEIPIAASSAASDELTMNQTPVTVRFEDDLLRQIDGFARKSSRQRNDIIRNAVRILFENGEQAADKRLSEALWGAGEQEAELEVIVMKETFPAAGGRQLVVFTPRGQRPDVTSVRAAIEKFLESERGKKGTQARRKAK